MPQEKMKGEATKGGESRVLVCMVLREAGLKIDSWVEDSTKGSATKIGVLGGGDPIRGDWIIPTLKVSKGAGIRGSKVVGIVRGVSRARRRGKMIRKEDFRKKVCVLRTLLTSSAFTT